jgi:flagellar capping protein FliD
MSNSKINIEEQKLIQYLEGNLSSEEAHAFEQQMADSALLNDAVEGLQQMNDNNKINQYVDDLNKQLKQYTSSKKKRRVNYKSQFNFWAIVAIVLILTLSVIAYLVLHKIRS